MATNNRASGCIFISYRREDASGHVLALVEALQARFGEHRVFIDTQSIEPGDDFIAAIRQEITSCSAVLVVIGREWLNILKARQQSRPVDGPNDLMRMEVGTALESKVLVVPVLVERTRMPTEEELPPDLRRLAQRNAIELRDNRWSDDVDHLVDILERKGVGGISWLAPRRRAVALIAAIVTVAVGLVLFLSRPEPRSIVPPPPAIRQADPAEQLAALTDRAWTSYRDGRPGDALKDIREGLRRAPNNSRLVDLRSSLLRDVQDSAGREEEAAISAGARRWAGVELSQATDASARAKTLLAGGDADGALEQFWAAEAGFRSAAKAAPAAQARAEAAVQAKAEAAARTRAEAAARAGAKQGLDAVLENFRAAYNKKDVGGIQRIFPEAQKNRVVERIKHCKSVSLTFAAKRIELLSKDRAQAEVRSEYGCQPNAGKKLPAETISETFKFEQRAGSWVIVQQLVPVP